MLIDTVPDGCFMYIGFNLFQFLILRPLQINLCKHRKKRKYVITNKKTSLTMKRDQ